MYLTIKYTEKFQIRNLSMCWYMYLKGGGDHSEMCATLLPTILYCEPELY